MKDSISNCGKNMGHVTIAPDVMVKMAKQDIKGELEKIMDAYNAIVCVHSMHADDSTVQSCSCGLDEACLAASKLYYELWRKL